ncbi:hypothetical protein RhiJN_02232 [Ceratobasidium sp. AG-Ba]|nr:hypothetical protein RhiJN_02232 [Ceratobasidium sp. AG-Ba]QRW03169.1 hypothetical protein RhiLY_02168 [Ceratobasidium sp. AG-Ba]
MTQRPRTSTTCTPPSAYCYPWTDHSASDPALAIGLGRPHAARYHSDRVGIPATRRSTHHISSHDMHAQEPSGPSAPKSALKVFTSVKRSFSIGAAKKSAGPSTSFTSSTAEETAAAQIRMTEVSTSSKPPTVQQIAAGFVTGLRPARAPLTRQRSTPLPPPPARSSLKKSPIDSGASSASSTSLASTSLMSTSTRTGSTTTAATSVASSTRHRSRFSIKDALFRRSASPTPLSLPVPTVPKAVRFHVSPVVEQTSLPPT